MENANRVNVYNYDVFISYKSQQETWAKRLAETLRSLGWRVWRDHDAGNGIRVSEVWSEEIRNGIRASRSMIVLWSNLIATDATTVVLHEINEMKALLQNDETGQRRFVPVNLDGTALNNFEPLRGYQADVSLQSLYQQYGDDGAYSVSAVEWFGALKTLIEALGIRDVMEVRFVVAAMTRAQAQQLYDEPATYCISQDAFLLMCEMMQKTAPFAVERYGNSPNDWKPFPQLNPTLTIRDIIDAYDDDKREESRARNEHAKWILVSYSDEIVAPSYQVRQSARASINSGPCLVIIDPVSLMHRDVFNFIITNASLHNHPDSFVIGVAPFVALMHNDLYDTTLQIDDALQQYIETAYDRFRRPFVPSNRTCVMNIEHEFQFMRWLQVAADGIVKANKSPMRSSGKAPHPANLQRMRRSVSRKPESEVINMGVAGGGDQ